MKTLAVIILALFITACNDQKGAPLVNSLNTHDIIGNYISDNKKSAINFGDGVLTFKAHGPYAATVHSYKINGDNIEVKFDMPTSFKINKDGSLLLGGITHYSKQ